MRPSRKYKALRNLQRLCFALPFFIDYEQLIRVFTLYRYLIPRSCFHKYSVVKLIARISCSNPYLPTIRSTKRLQFSPVCFTVERIQHLLQQHVRIFIVLHIFGIVLLRKLDYTPHFRLVHVHLLLIAPNPIVFALK